MNQIDMVWILFCSCMVLFMQAGFSCLEAGLIRAKNTINVVIKNTVDFAISVVGFALIGLASWNQWFHEAELMAQSTEGLEGGGQITPSNDPQCYDIEGATE